MFAVEANRLSNALEAGGESELSLVDLIDLYAQIIMDQSDMVDDETIQKLLCKQTKSYCDFDPTMRESSKMILGAKESTANIITAVKENDQEGLERAFEKLKGYQIRIMELEKKLHTDELTEFYNRRYLLSEKLENGKSFQDEGVMFVMQIARFKEINDLHGYAIGDSVLKFFARSISSIIKPDMYEVIRFSGAVFVLMVQEHQVSVIERKLQGLQKVIERHTFKTSKERAVEFGLSYGKHPYRRGENFLSVLKKGAQIHV